MLRTFIERPVLATVVSIFFIVLGTIGIFTLPVEQYPDIAPPTVRVSTSYSGADAQTVMNSVIVPLEEEINGVEGMTYMTSSAYNGGSASITIYFEQGVDPDIATILVQNRVSQASSLLPSEVTQVGVTVNKQQSGNILMIQMRSTNPDYDAKFVQNYASINIVPQISRVTGVGNVNAFGAGTYSMRIWLKPDIMKAYNITASEVVSALDDQNIEAAPGELGVQSEQTFQYTLRYTGRLETAEEFENIIVRADGTNILRVKDVADVELGAQSYQYSTKGNGYPATMLMVSQTAGSNAQDIIEEVKELMKEASKSFPEGVTYAYEMDASEFLNVSMNKLIETLIEVFILVFLIILVFLQNFRATFIPAIAVPVSVIGTFFFLQLFGFSINLLTLFALVLAIGMVVDDAIVVVEAVYANLDAGEKDSKKASIKTLGEIAPAIISMTLVSCAVFVPVSFIGGTSGVFFKQFGLTLAVAILISGVNALTLSPALSAIFLKAHTKPKQNDRNVIHKFYNQFNRFFSAATDKYENILRFLTKKNARWISIVAVLAFSALLWFVISMVPSGFVPQEDSGGLMGMVSLPPGSAMEKTNQVIEEITEITNSIPGIKGITSISGHNFMKGSSSAYATFIIKLVPWDERDMTADEYVALMQQKTAGIQDAQIMYFSMPTIHGFGIGTGVSMELQDRTGGAIEDFYDVTTQFANKLQQRKEILAVANSFDLNFPQKQISADIAKIKRAGLTLSEVMTELEATIGSMYISNFNAYGKQYRVIVQAAPEYREKIDDINNIYIETSSGEMAPISQFITIEDVTGPQGLTRFNMYTSMTLTIIPNTPAGYTSGDILKIIDETKLPEGYSYEYSGMTREEVSSSSNTTFIFLLCIIFVYLLLSALYESYIVPLAVIFSLPIGLSGVYFFVYLSMINGSGIVNNIYVQISLVMIIGLLAKTAILIVEYALQRRRQGLSMVEAAISGAVARLRPVMMTALTMIIGLIPLALATGAGALGNQSIGISAVGGMLFGTFIGILVVPVLFIIFQSLQEKVSKNNIQIEEHNENNA